MNLTALKYQKKSNAIYVLFSLFLSCFTINVAAQNITISAEEKLSNKFDDIKILGKNDFGTVIYFSGENANQLAILDDNLNVKVRKDINVQSKSIEEVVLLNDKILVIYIQNWNQMQYVKAKVLNKNLIENSTYVLDSLSEHINNKNRFYAKTSPDNSKLLVFTIIRNKGNMFLRFASFNDKLQVSARNMFSVIEKNDVSVRSVKINNSGFVYTVFGYEEGWSNDDYEFSNYLINYYNPTTKVIYESEIKNSNILYKKLITDFSLDDNFLYILSGYKHTVNKDNIGFYYQILDFRTNTVLVQKYLGITEEDVSESKTYNFKNWRDKVMTLNPKKIIPRSDGGFVFLVEGEFSFLKEDSRTNYSSMYNPLYYNTIPQEYRAIQYNTIGDIVIFSINNNGSVQWKNTIYKAQQSEDDDAVFSSFSLFEAKNVLKIIYNEDIFSSGNFVEYNVNPLGKYQRVSLMNTEKDDLNLMPRKGTQLDAKSILIPSQNKRGIRFVKIAY